MHKNVLLVFTALLGQCAFWSVVTASDRQVELEDFARFQSLYGGHQAYHGRAVSRIFEVDRQTLENDRPVILSEKMKIFEFGFLPQEQKFKFMLGNDTHGRQEPQTLIVLNEPFGPQIQAWRGPSGIDRARGNVSYLIGNSMMDDENRPLLAPVLYYLNQQSRLTRTFRSVQIDEFEQKGKSVRRLATDFPMQRSFLLVDQDTGHILEHQMISSRDDVSHVSVTFFQMEEDRPPASFFNTRNPNWTRVVRVAEEWGLAREPDWASLSRLDRGMPLEQPIETDRGGIADRGRLSESDREERSAEPPTQQLTREQMQALVLVENGSSSGSGFAARINDLPFVITNLHVLGDGTNLRLRTINGNTLRVIAAFAARGHDVALLRVEEIPASLAIAANVFDTVEIGDEVVVVGNRQGGGVATQVQGRIVGVGPDRVEVDARFQQGNSGSPIVHVKSGEVIGIATYMQEVAVQSGNRSGGRRPERETTTRWFGFRYDSITEWERVNWTDWKRQYDLVAAYRDNSEALLALLRNDREVYSRNNRLGPIIDRFERDLGQRTSEDYHIRRTRELFADLVNFSRADARALEGGFYDYFQTSMYFDSSIRLQKEFRQELLNFFEQRERDIRAHALRTR